MDAAILAAAALVGASIVGGLIIMGVLIRGGRQSEGDGDNAEVVRLAEEKVAAAESERDQARAERDDAREQLRLAEDNAQQLEIAKATSESNLANTRALNDKTADELKQVTARRDELQATNQKLSSDLSGVTAKFEDASKSLEQESKQRAELQDAHSDLTSQVRKLTSQHSSIEAELKSTKASLASETKENATLSEQNNDLTSQVRKLTGAHSSIEAELKSAKASLESGTKENATLSEQNSDLTSQVRKLTGAHSSIETELKSVKASLASETKKNATLSARNDDLTEQVAELSAKLSNRDTQLEGAEKRLEERGDLEKLFGDRFKTMSASTLGNQQKQFLERATETLKPLSDKVERLDREWVNTSGAFKQQIETLAKEARGLSNALTKPQARGQWGEIGVERVLELAGLKDGIHYKEQPRDSEGGRPDFIVHMPHERDIVLDSKVSLVAIIDASNATDDDERSRHLGRHARHMQDHADSLASKEYWSKFPNSVDYVVMVVPDFALPSAAERRPNLIDSALQKNVVITTHSTLVALLKTVAMVWQQRKLADESQEIGALGRELHDRLEVFASHYAKVGNELQQTVKAYNGGVGSLESRVLTQARRFTDLGVQSTKQLPEMQDIETSVRQMRSVPTPNKASDNGQ